MASILKKTSAEYSLLHNDSEEQLRSSPPASKSNIRLTIVHWAFHILSLVCVVGLIVYNSNLSRNFLRTCALRHNTWAPTFDVDSDPMDEIVFMGTFGAKTEYKGPPSNETTAAWARIWDVNTVNVTAETMTKMGRSLDSIQYPPEFGGGYMAQVEGVHQLHCLYMIWRDHHLHYFPVDQNIKDTRPAFYERHYEHCVDIIRQRLMCTADPGLVTFRWVEDEEIPEPDFNTAHMCASYDKLLEWNNAHAASIDVNDMHMRKPQGAVTVPHPP